MSENENIIIPPLDDVMHLASCAWCEAYGRTGIGGRSENQDAFSGRAKDNAVILTVCDGMGGMNGGQTASNIAVNEIMATLMSLPPDSIDEESLRQAISNANSAIYQRALDTPELRGMGTTATVLVLTPCCAYLTHVGDSRIYQFRKGKKVFRTFDHSRVFDMVAEGMMTEEEARQSGFSNIITRALGIRPQQEAEVHKLPYKKGDRFVLCTDGLWGTDAEPQIISMLLRNKDTEPAVTFLTEDINSLGVRNGGQHDNLTVIIADMKTDSTFQYSCWHKVATGVHNLLAKRPTKGK